MSEKLYIVKIGGHIIDDEPKLSSFLTEFAGIPGKKILVHGGGKLATRVAEQLGILQHVIDGRRITDAETLRVITMVYAGYINKNIVAGLQALQCNAIGLTGADADVVLAHRRTDAAIDYGFVGDVDSINADFLNSVLAMDLCPVIAPLTHDRKGQLLNTNADTIARELARGLSALFEVVLIFSFEKNGVLLDAADDTTVISKINPGYYQELRNSGKIFAGMIPKLDNAFAALDSGVSKVIIGRAEHLSQLIAGNGGTTLTNA